MMNPYVLATLLFYAASLALYIWNLREPSRGAGIGATGCLVGGLVLHYLALLDRSRMIHAVPYDDLFGSLSLFAWLLAATYLGLEAIHRRRSVGPFVLPIVLVVFLLAHAGEARPVKVPPAHGPLFAFHVTLNILAYAAFALSFVLSVIFLVQNQRLRQHKLGNRGMAVPAAGSSGDHDAKQCPDRLLFACRGNDGWTDLGAPPGRPVLGRRSQGNHHSVDLGGVRRIHAAGAHVGMARRARVGALHFQFSVCDFQLQYCESVSFAFSPLFLIGIDRRGVGLAFCKWKSFSSD